MINGLGIMKKIDGIEMMTTIAQLHCNKNGDK